MATLARTVRALGLTIAAVLLLVPVAVAGPPAGAAPAGYDGGLEAQFVASINQLRTSKGLNALTVDNELVGPCRTWADQMKAQGFISHAPDLSVGVSQNWQKLGENVGVGPSVQALMDAFIASPGHYANLVDPAFSRVGVGVVWDGPVMYTTHRFMGLQAAAPPAPAPVVQPAAEAASPGSSPPGTTPPQPAAEPDPAPTTSPPTTAPTTTTTAPPPAEPAIVIAILDALSAVGG